MNYNFDAIFNPKSIAVVGASRRKTHVGYGVLNNLIQEGYSGEIFPVNPNAEEILGRKCYPNLSAIGKPVDLVVFTVHPTDVKISILEAAKIGVKAAIVITAGYKEIGEKELERELTRVCTESGITLIGPNCLGVINPSIKMNASFARVMPHVGSVGFFSQSGALCVAVLDYADTLGVGFSKFVSTGNKAQIGELEMIQYFLDDPDTKVIAMYLEDLAHPHEIMGIIENAHKSGKMKPIIALKAGRTIAGASASASHTGALAGADETFSAFFAQAGIIRAEKVSELFDLIKVFSCNPIPKGKRIGIVTNAGGPGVLATDEATLRGLLVNPLSETTRAKLSEFLPKAANTKNPVDVVGDADGLRYEKALGAVCADPDVDIVLAIMTHQTMTQVPETANAIVREKARTEKPLIACFMGGNSVADGVNILHKGKVSMIEYPEEAARGAAALSLYSEYIARKEPTKFSFTDTDSVRVNSILKQAAEEGKSALSEFEALQVFSAYGLPVLSAELAHNQEEVMQKAALIGKTLVMKIVSAEILHKSDSGGVTLNISPENAGEEYKKLLKKVLANNPDAKIEGVLLEEMAEPGGFEIILGAKRDPALGPVVMVGIGGIYTEVFHDVALGLAPITKDDAWRIMNSLKAKKIFDGVRGQEPLDTDALVEMLGRLSTLITDHPEIAEIDINPLKIFGKGKGAKVLDARVILK